MCWRHLNSLRTISKDQFFCVVTVAILAAYEFRQLVLLRLGVALIFKEVILLSGIHSLFPFRLVRVARAKGANIILIQSYIAKFNVSLKGGEREALNFLRDITSVRHKGRTSFNEKSLTKIIQQFLGESIGKYQRSEDYIDFGELYDNNFEHLNPDDMPNNENNLTSNDVEQPMHANMPLESNTQEENIDQTEKTFNDTYLLYEKKYSVGTIATQTAPTVHLFGSSSSSSAAIFGMLASKGKQKSVISSRTEVFKYLDTEFVKFMTKEERNNFNILDWWKAHEKNFPVLSIMACDVLTTPVSTVASESAFSAGGRVLDEKRTRLTPQICEALMCLKDWEDADFRTQSFVDEDLSYFEDDSTSSLNEVS
ncbi:unnamed protein product [Prunus armeniaca]